MTVYPARLADLVKEGLLRPRQVVCPAPKAGAPPRTPTAPPPRGRTRRLARVIVWDSRPDNHPDGGWVLWRDGLTQWVGATALARLSSQSPEPAATPARGGPEP